MGSLEVYQFLIRLAGVAMRKFGAHYEVEVRGSGESWPAWIKISVKPYGSRGGREAPDEQRELKETRPSAIKPNPDEARPERLYDVELWLCVEASDAAEALSVASEVADLILRFARASEGSGATKLERIRDIDLVQVTEHSESESAR